MPALALHDSEAVAAQKRVKERLNLVDLSRTGFHFCLACQRVTEDIGEAMRRCCHCGSVRVKWNPPAVTDDPI
jgi:hypothetical protein